MAATGACAARVLRRNNNQPPPFQAILDSSWRRNSYQPCSRMDLFKPDLARTFLPSASAVPAADFDIFRTRKSSIPTIAWFLQTADEILCRKSRQALAMRP